MATSEVRAYRFILDSLRDMGWDIQPPHRGGQVYTQTEAFKDPFLKTALVLRRPENIVVIGNAPKRYWVIEAKADVGDMEKAIEDAEEVAGLINGIEAGACPLITGVAGDPDFAHMVETRALVSSGDWEPLVINGRQSTGFISPDQVNSLLDSGSATLDEYETDDDLFIEKADRINKILHDGGVNKRNRAAVLASLLLAVAYDPQLRLDRQPKIMINDINNRANEHLNRYEKSNFFGEIQINLPTSDENHEKHRTALVDTIDILRGLNIASAINSGRDVLGEFYERFLKYANDAKELGIVFTPRHITSFACNIVDVQRNNVVFDPACGTGGFLVASLDKVRRETGEIDEYKRGNLYGIEQDPLIAALAIVNMIFRGDGSSNIIEGDGLKANPDCKPDKCLLNPPFAKDDPEFEWAFVDRALNIMQPGGLLFSILPTTTMVSATDSRKEQFWRTSMLKKHRLLAVVKLPEDLFYPNVSKGTYGVLIRAHTPHKIASDKVFWAVMDDGQHRTKTGRNSRGNIEELEKALRRFVIANDEPDFVPQQMDCTVIRTAANKILDLSPERHIDRDTNEGSFDLSFLSHHMEIARLRLSQPSGTAIAEASCRPFFLEEFIGSVEKGKSGRGKNLLRGSLPLVSTSENTNGISELVDPEGVSVVYPPGGITVSSNGASCRAFFHDYEFAANGDVWVLTLKEPYDSRAFSVFLCAAINNESWRYNYFRKFNQAQLKEFTVQIPVNQNNAIDFERIERLVSSAGLKNTLF